MTDSSRFTRRQILGGLALGGAAGTATWALGRGGPSSPTTALPPAGPAEVAPAATVPAATPGGRNGGGKPRDPGELAALTFSLLEAGKHAVDIVRELKLQPEQVAAFLRDWKAMKEGQASNRTTEDRLRLLEEHCHELEEKIGAWEGYAAGQLASKIDGISQYVRSLAAPSASTYACDCGARGMVAVRVVCTQCGLDRDWGFYPK